MPGRGSGLEKGKNGLLPVGLQEKGRRGMKGEGVGRGRGGGGG